MYRKSLWLGVTLMLVVAAFVAVSVDARPKKKRIRVSRSGPPSLSLAAEPYSLSACEDAPAIFTATISGGSPNMNPIYNWTVSAGRIISGQGTPRITVDTRGTGGQGVTASVDVGGYGMPCPAGCSIIPEVLPRSNKFDEYYNIARNDEKARLDNYVIQLQNQPGAMGYIIVYPARRASANEAQARATRISDYLVNTRGIEASRFHIMMGPAREDWLFELWIVPTGAPPPTPSR